MAQGFEDTFLRNFTTPKVEYPTAHTGALTRDWKAGDLFWRSDPAGVRLIYSVEGDLLRYVRLHTGDRDQIVAEYLQKEIFDRQHDKHSPRRTLFLGNNQELLGCYVGMLALMQQDTEKKLREAYAQVRRMEEAEEARVSDRSGEPAGASPRTRNAERDPQGDAQEEKPQ